MDYKASWGTIVARKGDTVLKYVDANGNYYIYLKIEENTELLCILDKSSSDAQAFDANYKNSSNSILVEGE